MRFSRVVFTLVFLAVTSLQLRGQVSCSVTLQATPLNASCDNACNGSVVLTPSGGVAPYSFNAFDHNFPGNSVDPSLFNVRNGNFSVSNNRLQAVASPLLDNEYDNSISTQQAFPATNKIVIEASFFIDFNTYGNWGLANNIANITDKNQIPFSFFFNYGTLFIEASGNRMQIGNYSANTWYDFKIEKLGNTVNYYMRNTGISTYTLVATRTTTNNSPSFKMAATYYNFYSFYGGFITTNWKVGGNPPTTGLCPGTYTYTVYDAVGCFATQSVTVGAGGGPNALVLTGSVTEASCELAQDGKVELTPLGGVGPFSFDFAHVFQGTTINTNVFELRNGNFSQSSDLRQGVNYNNNNSWDNSISTRQTFSDGGLMVLDASFKFDANAEVIFGFTGTGVIDDISDVYLGFRIANGSNLFAYTRSAGAQQLLSLPSGTWYDFRIEKLGTVVNFYYRPHNTGMYILVHTANFFTSNIEFKVAALNFANFYSSSGGYNTKGWNVQVTPKLTEMAPGVYTYTIKDAAGCTATETFTVGVSKVDALALTANLVQPALGNAANGSVSLAPSGGSGTYNTELVPAFTGNRIDLGMFTVNNGSFSQSAGAIRAATVVNPGWNNSLYTNLAFPDHGQLEFRASFMAETNANFQFGFVEDAELTAPAQVQIGLQINGTQLIARVAGSADILLGSNLIIPGTWYDFKIEKTGALVRFYMRSGAGAYTRLMMVPYTGTGAAFRAGVLMFGTGGGFYTRGWALNNNPSTTALAPGQHHFRIYDTKGCYATASVVVPSSDVSMSLQSTATSVYNQCDGAITAGNTPAGAVLAQKVFAESFAGTTIDHARFTVVNGAYTQQNSLQSGNLYNGNGWNNSIITSQSFADNGFFVVEMEMRLSSQSELAFGLMPATGSVTSFSQLPFGFYYSGNRLFTYSQTGGAVQLGTVVPNQWHGFRIEKTGNVVNYYFRHAPDTFYQLAGSVTASVIHGAYRVGIVNAFGTQATQDRRFASRNWRVFAQPVLNGLCTGDYHFALMAAGSTLLQSSVTVTTNLPMVKTMTAPADLVVNNDPGAAFATVSTLGTPGFSSAPTGITISNNAPATFPVGTTEVTWTATDSQGNSHSVTQQVTVNDNEAPVITAPANITATLFAGQSSINISLGDPVVHDNVATGVQVSNNAPQQFAAGTFIITWTATDVAGNSATAEQIVTVVASALPVVTAPQDLTVPTDSGKNFASNVSLGVPALSYNNPTFIVTNDAPAIFNLGTTTVTWTVSDGFSAITATQLITVADMEAPVLIVPASVAATTDFNKDFASNVALGIPIVTDNVATGITITNNAPATFPVGQTIVTWTAIDAAGNTVNANQMVTVTDNQPPVITAPPDISVSNSPGLAEAIHVTLGSPVVSDNVATALAVTNNAPANFPIGVTTVTWTVTDAAGNVATATQLVTVIDDEKPVIAAPADIAITVSSSANGASGVALGSATATDNAPGSITISNNAPSFFPIGTTTVLWTAVDASGNQAQAQQMVTIQRAVEDLAFSSLTTEVNRCFNETQNGAYLIPSVTATGGANITYSFVITGATNRSGNGNNASGSFNQGVSWIQWKARTPNGNEITGTTRVVISSPISVSIPPAQASPQGTQANNIYLGFAQAESLSLQALVSGGNAPYQFTWKSPSSALQISHPVQSQRDKVKVTANSAGNFTSSIEVTDARGCKGTAVTIITVNDIRCGNNANNPKVLVCQRTNSARNPWVQICVSENAVAAHLAQGSVLGACPTGSARGIAATEPVKQVLERSAKVYPNPSAGLVQLQLSGYEPGKITIQVTDQWGRTILTNATTVGFERENYTIDLSRQAAGVYMVRILDTNGIADQVRVVIAR